MISGLGIRKFIFVKATEKCITFESMFISKINAINFKMINPFTPSKVLEVLKVLLQMYLPVMEC